MDLTRRALLGRAAALASGAVAGGALLAPDVVFAGGDGEAVFKLRTPRGRMHGGRWESGAIQPRRAFELAGVAIGGAHLHGVEMRARSRDGRWSEWIAVGAGHEHGPDSPRGGAAAGRHRGGRAAGGASAARRAPAKLSDPVWLGPSDALELRAPRSLAGAELLLVDGGRPAVASAARRYVDSGLPAGPGQPPIIARSSWATRSCRPRVPAVFGDVELAFVHHTVSSNYYRRSQSAAMVRSICLFHKYGNGWNDIGYNFVVDRYGQIFEARAGGIDDAIVGAQAGGYNAFSTGVALLGNFAGHAPSRQTFNALSELLAWKLALHGIEVPGRVTVRVTRDGAPYSRYRAGARVHLNRISGHRDADTTECPGSAMYRQLPRLRKAVERQIGSVSRLGAAIQAVSPGSAVLGGSLAGPDGPIGGATVEVQQHSTTRPPQTLAAATTNPDGSWSAGLALATNAQLRAVYRGDDTGGAAVSANVVALVPPQVTLTAASAQTIPGGVVEFDGTTAPAKPKVTIVVAQQQPDGTFAEVRSVRVNANEDGTFTKSLGFAAAGTYQVVAHTAPDRQNTTGTSAPVTVTVL